jgi:hypothetical protein
LIFKSSKRTITCTRIGKKKLKKEERICWQ